MNEHSTHCRNPHCYGCACLPDCDEREEKMADPIKEPKHYKHPSGIEAIQITSYESFLRGNILKYILRAPYKGTELQDLKKAEQYLRWEIARIEALEDDNNSCT